MFHVAFREKLSETPWNISRQGLYNRKFPRLTSDVRWLMIVHYQGKGWMLEKYEWGI